MTIHESKRLWLACGVGLAWFLLLLWPLLGIKPDTLEFATTFKVFGYVAVAAVFIMFFYQVKEAGYLDAVGKPAKQVSNSLSQAYDKAPTWLLLGIVLAAAIVYPLVTGRYAHDVAISVLIYVCLGLGLNIVIGLAGLLDLGYIAFYGVGAYTYAILSINFGLSFWLCLPIAAVIAAIAGCIIGYPTLRMRGDYLAIVTLASARSSGSS